MKIIKSLGWRNYYLLAPAFDNVYTLRCRCDRKRMALLKLIAAYCDGRWDWLPEGVDLKIIKFCETVGTHNVATFLLWFSKQPEYNSVLQSILQEIPEVEDSELQFDSIHGLAVYLHTHSELLDAQVTITMPGINYVETNGGRLAAILLRAKLYKGGSLNRVVPFTEQQARTALKNLAEVTPITISELSASIGDYSGRPEDALLFEDYLYAEILRMYDVTMKYDSLTDVVQKNTKIVAF